MKVQQMQTEILVWKYRSSIQSPYVGRPKSDLSCGVLFRSICLSNLSVPYVIWSEKRENTRNRSGTNKASSALIAMNASSFMDLIYLSRIILSVIFSGAFSRRKFVKKFQSILYMEWMDLRIIICVGFRNQLFALVSTDSIYECIGRKTYPKYVMAPVK